MANLKLYLLGAPAIERDGKLVKLDRHKIIALMAYLILTGQEHTRDALATLLWPELDQSRARAGLRRVLAAIRKSINESILIIDRSRVGMNPEADLWVDITALRKHLASTEAHAHVDAELCPNCLAHLEAAIKLYRGDLLAGFTLSDTPDFDEWVYFEGEELRQELASALARLVRVYGAQEQFNPAIRHARRWLALDPLQEPVHRQLMHLYALSGNQATALRQYQQCEQLLQDEMGTTPSVETKELFAKIREGRLTPTSKQEREPTGRQPATHLADRMEKEHPATDLLGEDGSAHGDRPSQDFEPFSAASSTAVLHNLPIQPTPFVGREEELATLCQHLTNPVQRLTTLLGLGGMGKTRLALAAAETLLDDFSDGVYFISLADLDTAEPLVPAVAAALNLTFYAGGIPEQQLLDYLRHKELLLILDNFEQLLAAGVQPGSALSLIIDILKMAPGVKLLVTSRARLKVQGEQLIPVNGVKYPIGSMSEDVDKYDAVKLFVQSARSVQPRFELTTVNRSDVIQLCQLMQGMPLGLVLAAAWVEMLTPAEIVVELEHSLDFLETDLQDVPERQRSVRAIFDSTWRLLTEREQTVFQRLCVLRGGCSRAAAQEISGASLRNLMSLVHKSLLRQSNVGRYYIHELLRQLGAEKLNQTGQEDDVRNAHTAYFANFLCQRQMHLQGRRHRKAMHELEEDRENIRTAWLWMVKQKQVEQMSKVDDVLGMFYEWRGHYRAGEAAFRLAADRLIADQSRTGQLLRVKCLTWQGRFQRILGEGKRARRSLEQGLVLLDSLAANGQEVRQEKAAILEALGYVVHDFDRTEARRLFEQSLALFRELDHKRGIADLLEALFHLAGDRKAAMQNMEECLRLRNARGDQRGVANALMYLGQVAVFVGQAEQGELWIRQSLVQREEINDQAGLAQNLSRLGYTLIYLGQFKEAHSVAQETVTRFEQLGNRQGLAYGHLLLGAAKLALGQHQQARVQGMLGVETFREISDQAGVETGLWLLGQVALAEQAFEEAQRLLDQVVVLLQPGTEGAIALEIVVCLGHAAFGLRDLSQARHQLCAALHTALENHDYCGIVFALPLAALLLAEKGNRIQAVEIYALALQNPRMANSRWFAEVTGEKIASVAKLLPADTVTAAQDQGKARDLWETAQGLLTELG